MKKGIILIAIIELLIFAFSLFMLEKGYDHIEYDYLSSIIARSLLCIFSGMACLIILNKKL